MTFLFATIGVLAVGYLLWRAFGPQLSERTTPTAGRGRPAPKGPDDDPDFLRDLDRRSRGPNGADGDDR
ncbi:hypothetical protein GCM10009624_00940 [Gordonia sinesedis]